jgi:hypothetical protein
VRQPREPEFGASGRDATSAAARRDTDGMADIAARLADLDWTAIERSLWEWGYAKTPPVLTPDECAELIALYDDDARFRSRVDMARYRFGLGEYKYFAAPLPPAGAGAPHARVPAAAAIANQWEDRARDGDAALPRRTRAAGALPPRRPDEADAAAAALRGRWLQLPAPGHLRRRGFPLQLTCFLSRRAVDYEGGDFLLVEQRAPRAVARRVHRHRAGRDRDLRHAAPARAEHARLVSRRHAPRRQPDPCAGSRYTLGVIFHDAA